MEYARVRVGTFKDSILGCRRKDYNGPGPPSTLFITTATGGSITTITDWGVYLESIYTTSQKWGSIMKHKHLPRPFGRLSGCSSVDMGYI